MYIRSWPHNIWAQNTFIQHSIYKSISMIKRLLSLVSSGLLVAQVATAQSSKGILPLTGIRYFSDGIWSKHITVRIDGQQLLGNRVPLNKEITVNIPQPSGFTEGANKFIYAGAELTITSPKGEVLMKNPNVFLKNEAAGFDIRALKELNVKFGITPDILRNNNALTIAIRLFDLKGKNQLRLEFPVGMTRPNEPLALAKAATPLKSNDPSPAMVNGITTKGMKVSLDTTISVSPKMAYMSLVIADIEGSSIDGIFKGKENFWVYDANLNEIKIKDILLKQVKGSMESNTVEYTLKIPYRPKASPDKGYIVRFRWEGEDPKKLIDVVVNR